MGKLDDLSLKMVIATLKFADVALSKEVAKTVKTHAFIGAICMAIPLFGLETIIYNGHFGVCMSKSVSMHKFLFGSILPVMSLVQ